MPENLLTLIWELLPGFVALKVVEGLTPQTTATPFQRSVDALVYTAVTRAIVVGMREASFALASWAGWSAGVWNAEAGLVWSVLVAVFLGIFLAWSINHDVLTGLLREGLRSEARAKRRDQGKVWLGAVTSYPSEWFHAFDGERNYVVLHLQDGRRLYGYPYEWPNEPKAGWFVMTEPEWLVEGGSIPVPQTEKLLVCGADVKMVEFVKFGGSDGEQTTEAPPVAE